MFDDLLGGLHTVELRHREVHYNNLRLKFVRHSDGLDTVTGLADYLHGLLVLEDATKTAAYQAVVVRQEYGYLFTQTPLTRRLFTYDIVRQHNFLSTSSRSRAQYFFEHGVLLYLPSMILLPQGHH